MRRVLLVSLCVAAACGVPASDDRTLVDALVDLHLLEARHMHHGDVPEALRDSVLARHGFTPQVFEATLGNLTTDLDHAAQVYAAVQNRLDSLDYDDPRERLSRDQ